MVGGEVFCDEVGDAELASVVLLPCPASEVKDHAGEQERRRSQDRRAAAAVAAVRREQTVARGVSGQNHSCCAVAVRGPVDDAAAVDLAGLAHPNAADADLDTAASVADQAATAIAAEPARSAAENTEDIVGSAGSAERAGRLDRVAVAGWRARLAGLPVGPAVAAQLALRPAAPSVVDVSPRAGGSDQFVWANTLLDSITARRQLINHLQALQARDEYDLERNYPGLVENLPFEVGAALHLTDHQAERELTLASSSYSRLPAAAAAWRTGRICGDKVRSLTEQTQKLELGQARAVAEKVLPNAPEQTVPAFRAAVRRAVLDIDPEGADRRHRDAREDRRVRKYVLEDGMAEFRYTDAAQHVQLLWEVVNELGRAAKTPGDRRTADQRRADSLADVADVIARHGLLLSDPTDSGPADIPGPAAEPAPEDSGPADDPAPVEKPGPTDDPTPAEDPAVAEDPAAVDSAAVENSGPADDPAAVEDTDQADDSAAVENSGPAVDPAVVEISGTAEDPAAVEDASAVDHAPARRSGGPGAGRTRRRKRIRPRVRVNVTMPITVLAGGFGTCELAGYGPITAGQAWTLAGDAELRRMLCDPIDGTLLAAGVSTVLCKGLGLRSGGD